MPRASAPPRDRSFAARAAEGFRAEGGRLTAPRRALLSLLATAKRPLGPPELHEELRRRGLRVDRASVYRNVATLLELGLLHRVPGSSAVRPCEDGEPRCHHAVVCLACGAAREFHSEALERAFAAVRRATRYRVLDHLLELRGLCPQCQGR